ncbi:MAG: hypothetical protein R3F42_09195 [Pseudomonadota bacterium]
MKRLLALLLLGLPALGSAEDYQSTLLVQTGTLRESDLIVRTVTDLESNKICLAFYIRTMGTSPVMSCYDTQGGFRSQVSQTGHFKNGKLVVRKIKDKLNNVSCLVAYVSAEGTSPAINCYRSSPKAKDEIQRTGRLREGDLEIERILDADSTKTCLIAYVSVGSANPTLTCYDSISNGKGAMSQSAYLREGDLVVRKILDEANRKECLVSYVSTEGTSPYIHCFDRPLGLDAPAAAAAPVASPPPPARPAGLTPQP